MLSYDAIAPLHLSLLLVACCCAVSALEDLWNFQPFESGEILGWEISRLRFRFISDGWGGRLLDPLLAGQRFQLVLWASLPIALMAFASLLWPFLALPSALLLLAFLILNSLRSLYGLDGSDQMSLIVLTAASIAFAVPADSVAYRFCEAFVAAQLVLAYAISGLAKLASPAWRSGQALIGILSTSSYGNPKMYRLLKAVPQLSFGVCWLVILAESLFPLCLLLPADARLLWLGGMVLFHIGNAVIMGLNNFLFAFVAAFPPFWSFSRFLDQISRT